MKTQWIPNQHQSMDLKCNYNLNKRTFYFINIPKISREDKLAEDPMEYCHFLINHFKTVTTLLRWMMNKKFIWFLMFLENTIVFKSPCGLPKKLNIWDFDGWREKEVDESPKNGHTQDLPVTYLVKDRTLSNRFHTHFNEECLALVNKKLENSIEAPTLFTMSHRRCVSSYYFVLHSVLSLKR